MSETVENIPSSNSQCALRGRRVELHGGVIWFVSSVGYPDETTASNVSTGEPQLYIKTDADPEWRWVGGRFSQMQCFQMLELCRTLCQARWVVGMLEGECRMANEKQTTE